ncbi:hypothetical protein DPEC_G00103210 [Dallia pectoralis]|uniref:Uncharacterized protein n=1 Tax=Dallia pectoralis TaxID=75939 RepID=A0ACC2GX97_DALPE|nr:hypothetical protein DPEC_G00103210 [Dallia pectoralis]
MNRESCLFHQPVLFILDVTEQPELPWALGSSPQTHSSPMEARGPCQSPTPCCLKPSLPGSRSGAVTLAVLPVAETLSDTLQRHRLDELRPELRRANAPTTGHCVGAAGT